MSDPYDILTLAEAQAAVGVDVTDSDEDTPLAAYTTAVSRLLDRRIGPSVARTVTGEVHDGGSCSIILRRRPVMSIGSLLEYTGTLATTLSQMTAASIPVNGYRLEPYDPQPDLYNGIVHRVGSSRYAARFPWGTANVICSYTAGRVASTTAVDQIIKQAATITLKNLWRDKQQSAGGFDEFDVPVQNFPTFGLPRAAADLLVDLLGQNEPWGIA